MRAVPIHNVTAVLVVLVAMSSFVRADDAKALQQKLESKYPLTVINAEGEVVTQGVVLTLKKSVLTAGAVRACANDYKEGRVTPGGVLTRCVKMPGLPAGTMRGFVAGEKLYATKIEVKDSVFFTLISDPIADVRYKADLKFVFEKGDYPNLAQTDRLVAEVFTITYPDGQQQGGPAAPAGKPTVNPKLVPIDPPAPDRLPEIAPPPPPPDQPAAPPQTLTLGQTIDQVVGILGQPTTVADLGSKKIYTYKNPNLKITFVDGKVTNME